MIGIARSARMSATRQETADGRGAASTPGRVADGGICTVKSTPSRDMIYLGSGAFTAEIQQDRLVSLKTAAAYWRISASGETCPPATFSTTRLFIHSSLTPSS